MDGEGVGVVSANRGGPVKLRLFAVAGIAATIGAAVAPADATPYAGQFRYLSTGTMVATGADGARWLLSIVATQGGAVESRAEQKLYIDLSRCVRSTCTAVGKWSRALAANEISIGDIGAPYVSQPATARLHTVLGGMNLDVTLTTNGVEGVALDSLGIVGGPVGATPQVEQYAYAGGSARLARLACKVASDQGAVGAVEGADTVGDDVRDPRTAPPAKLPAGFMTGTSPARC